MLTNFLLFIYWMWSMLSKMIIFQKCLKFIKENKYELLYGLFFLGSCVSVIKFEYMFIDWELIANDYEELCKYVDWIKIKSDNGNMYDHIWYISFFFFSYCIYFIIKAIITGSPD